MFVQRRFAACVLSKLINTWASKEIAEQRHLKSDFVTGHGSDLWASAGTAMNYKKQKEKLLEFKKGSFNVLVGTSVIEEGVDIPKCNLVIMFDFPNDFRAYVQSRGRGRADGAKYVYLVESRELEEKEQKIKVCFGWTIIIVITHTIVCSFKRSDLVLFAKQIATKKCRHGFTSA